MNRCECPVDESLGCLTNHAAFAARNYITRRLEEYGIDMTIEQFKVMMVLWKEKVSTQQNIADFIGKDKTSITRLIDGLVKRSLVRRTTDAHDKRCNLITLTEQGMALEAPTIAVLNAANDSIQREFTPEELSITRSVLKRMCHLIHYPLKESE